MTRLPFVEQLAGAAAEDRLAAAGRPGGQPRRGVQGAERGRRPVGQRGPAEAGPAAAGGLRVVRLGRGHLVGRDGEQDRVVHDREVARQHVAAGDVAVGREVRVEQEAVVVVVPAGRRRRQVGAARHRQGPELLPRTQRRGRVGAGRRRLRASSAADAEGDGTVRHRRPWSRRPVPEQAASSRAAAASSASSPGSPHRARVGASGCGVGGFPRREAGRTAASRLPAEEPAMSTPTTPAPPRTAPSCTPGRLPTASGSTARPAWASWRRAWSTP